MPNLYVTFRESARRQAAKTAVYWGETEWTYRDLLAQSEWVTARLQEQFGIRPGDRVGLWVRNCPEFITALFGILGAGAVAVPINNFLKAAEVSHIAQDAGLRAMVTEMAQEPALGEIRESVPGLPALAIEEFPPAAGLATTGRPAPDGAASALAVLIYTSGTTGRPKGAMLTHGNLLHNVESCRQVLAIVELDRFVLMLPMFHSFMLTVCILLPLAVGGSIVLIKSLQHPKHAVGEMIRHQGTILPAMAALFRALAHLPPEVHLPLRLCISGAGPLPAEILKAFNARHPQVPLIEGYGLSEASPVVSVNPVQGPWIAGTIGRPIPDVEMSVQDETGRALPEGEVGEICVRGGNVMQGYWNDPAKTAEALAGGWLRTGDIGYRRPDGYYVITDRKKDMLKPNGINVYPREIEEVVYAFPGVREAAVVGEPCERRGERPVVFLSLDEGRTLDEKALHDFLRERLADFKLPRRAIVLPALPRNATGKILKTQLREMLKPAA